jgi:UDP-N-acetylmuramoylalanine--D-glutamate ligase
LEESPQIAVITNITPNHLDRHGTFERYIEAKRAILDYQQPGDVAVINDDDPITAELAQSVRGHLIRFSVNHEPDGDAAFMAEDKLILRLGGREDVVALRDTLRLPGVHNTANALAAAAAACAYGVQPWEITEALAMFNGLPHRLEMVARTSGDIRFYNDSIATTPESAICALRSFHGPVTIIAGGSDKGVGFDELGEVIASRARRVILLGATADRLEQAISEAICRRQMPQPPKVVRVKSLEEAAKTAAGDALPGETILLSPACASFDMFQNFQERGDKFRCLAQTYAQ